MPVVEDELKSAQEGKNLLASMVVDLETQLEGAKAEKAEAYVDNSSLANEVRRLEGMVAELTTERDTLISDSAREKSVMSKSIEELQAQLDGLVFERDGAEKAKRRSEDAWRLERQNLEEQLRKSRKFNDELNEQLATKELEHARALAEKQEARHVSRSERQMRELFEGHLSEAKNHQDVLRVRMRELEAEAAEATAQYHKVGDTVYSLQDRCSELETAKAALAKQAALTEAMLTDEIKDLKVENATIKSEKDSLAGAVNDLKDMLITEKGLTSRKTGEIASLTAEVKKLKNKMSDANLDEGLLCQQVNQLKETIALLSKEKQGMLQQKSGEKETYMEELRVLRQALNMAEQNTEAALTQVRTEKNTITLEMSDLAEQLAAANSQVESLSAQLDTAENAVASALADKEEFDGQRRFLEGEVREITNQLATARAEKEARDVEIAELQVLLRSQEVELQDDRGDLTRTKTDAAVMIRDQDEMRATFERLRDENELLHAQVAQLNDHLQNIEVNNRRLEMEVGSAQAQAQVNAQQYQQAAQQQQQAQFAVPQLDRSEEYRGLVGENERMRDRVIALEEELAQTIANKEVDRSILEEQLHHAEARAEKAELVDEIEDKLREALEEIARLESELVQTRAEAAERDIQWQAEVDALAETYEKLQMELKKRERDIEEMKEGAWLSAELQYMAKKVEDYEIDERKHVQEQKEILDKLEDKDREIAFMAAKMDEMAGSRRALEEELNDERFTNKDLIRELHSLQKDLEDAERDKEKALVAAEKFVSRTVQATSNDRGLLKDALTNLQTSLDTIRGDKARQLAEKDMVISDTSARNYKLEKDVAGVTKERDDFKTQLEQSQAWLKAAMASSASRFGQTLTTYRSGLISNGFKTWVSWFTTSKMESKIEDLTLALDLARNQGKMMALSKIFKRWKNLGLSMGWREWHALYLQGLEDRRVGDFFKNMTDAEKKKALERLNNIIRAWAGENLASGMQGWKLVIKQKKDREQKVKFAARKWYNAKLAAGWNSWLDFHRMSDADKAQVEINELNYKLKRSLQSWMKDKFMYEARIYSEAQKSRTFQCWKYHTQDVSRTTERMKLMLGTMKRDKARNAFAKYQAAVKDSRLKAADLLDQKLLADAKAKALGKMARVIKHAQHGQVLAGMNSWKEYIADVKLWKIDEAFRKQLEAAEAEGYTRARGEFEPDIVFLRDALKKMRDGAFSKFLDTFLLGNAARGKTYAMSSWRSYVHDRAGRDAEEARKKVLADLKKANADLEAEIAAQKDIIKKKDNEIRRLHEDAAEQDLEFQDKLKQMKIDLQAAISSEEMMRSGAQQEKKHLEAMIKNKESQLSFETDSRAEDEAKNRRQIMRLEKQIAELETSVEVEQQNRTTLLQKTKAQSNRIEMEVSSLREELVTAQSDARRSRADLETVQDTSKSSQLQVRQLTADLGLKNSQLQEKVARVDELDRNVQTLTNKLKRATDSLQAAGIHS